MYLKAVKLTLLAQHVNIFLDGELNTIYEVLFLFKHTLGAQIISLLFGEHCLSAIEAYSTSS